MKAIVGQLDEDEEDGGEGAVDAQSHGSRRQSLWTEVQLCFLLLNHNLALATRAKLTFKKSI